MLLGQVGVHRLLLPLLGDSPPHGVPFRVTRAPLAWRARPLQAKVLRSSSMKHRPAAFQNLHLYLIFIKTLGGVFCNYGHFLMRGWRHRTVKRLVTTRAGTRTANIHRWDLNPGLPEASGCVNCCVGLCPPQTAPALTCHTITVHFFFYFY